MMLSVFPVSCPFLVYLLEPLLGSFRDLVAKGLKDYRPYTIEATIPYSWQLLISQLLHLTVPTLFFA